MATATAAATAAATPTAAIVGNKRHVRVKGTPTQQQQQQQQQDDGDNNMQHTGPHTHTGAPQDVASCQLLACLLLPALVMAIVVINGRHNKWVKCPDWVSVSALSLSLCVCWCEVWQVPK